MSTHPHPHIPDHSLLLGIDLGGTKTASCVGTAGGKILATDRIPSRASDGYEVWLDAVAEQAGRVIATSGVDRAQLAGVGLSAPGPLSVRHGMLLAPPNNPGWVDVPVVADLEARLEIPVYMQNDANACALAEAYYGKYHNVDYLVYLTASTGMGGGIISKGELIQGFNDQGGEVGFMPMERGGRVATNGIPGSFETYTGGKNLADWIRADLEANQPKTSILDIVEGDAEAINIQTLVSALDSGDPYAGQVWDDFLDRVAQGLGAIVQVINPEVVLFGTIAVHTGERFLAPVRNKLQQYATPASIEGLVIEASSLGSNIGDLSALAAAREGLEHQTL